jgi:filamentous hemagglutinin
LATKLDNRGGVIISKNNLSVQLSGDWENTGGGLMSIRGAAHLQTKVLRNQGGFVAAGETLTVTADTIHGSGTLKAGRDLALTVNQGLVQEGKLGAGQNLTLTVAGNLVNKGQVAAERDLILKAANLSNEAYLLAGLHNIITVSQNLTNTGLIDGGLTRLEANHITNHGRIYGGRVAIKSAHLVNEKGPTGVGIIASRGDLDIGATNITNRDHATIVAPSDLRIGGTLDASHYAAGVANSLINSAAIIEVGRHASFAATSFQNLNPRFTSGEREVSVAPKVYYRPDGSTTLYDGATTWLCDLVTPMCSKDPDWLGDDEERRFLLPSAQYPDSQYGPPFPEMGRGIVGHTTPIKPAYYPPLQGRWAFGGGGFLLSHPTFKYAPNADIWQRFGVTPPQGAPPEVHSPNFRTYIQPYLELNKRIQAFNADFVHRLIKVFSIYRVNETVTETRMVTTDPAKILVGGNATFTGTGINDKSQIAAGGVLTVAGPAIQNLGATGERRVVISGTATGTWKEGGRRVHHTHPYTSVTSVTPISLAVATAAGGQSVAIGQASGVTAATVSSNPVGHVVIPALEIKQVQQHFTESALANTPYLVVADPQFMGTKPVVSEKNLRQLLQQMDALPLSMPRQ